MSASSVEGIIGQVEEYDFVVGYAFKREGDV